MIHYLGTRTLYVSLENPHGQLLECISENGHEQRSRTSVLRLELPYASACCHTVHVINKRSQGLACDAFEASAGSVEIQALAPCSPTCQQLLVISPLQCPQNLKQTHSRQQQFVSSLCVHHVMNHVSRVHRAQLAGIESANCVNFSGCAQFLTVGNPGFGSSVIIALATCVGGLVSVRCAISLMTSHPPSCSL